MRAPIATVMPIVPAGCVCADEIAALADSNSARIDRLSGEVAAYYNTHVWLLGLVTLFVVFGGIVLAILFVRRLLTQPLGQVNDAMKKLAAGDTTAPVPADRGDEIGDMAKAMRVLSAPGGRGR